MASIRRMYKNNVLLIDLENKAAALCYSTNALTKRVCGIMLQSPDTKNTKKDILDTDDILYLLTYCTTDTPILLLFIDFEDRTETIIKNKREKTEDGKYTTKETEEQTKEKYINISYRYITTKPDEGDKRTNIFKPNNLYYSLTNAQQQAGSRHTPQEMGLADAINIKLVIQYTNEKRLYKSKTFTYPYYAVWHETEEITFKSAKELEEEDRN